MEDEDHGMVAVSTPAILAEDSSMKTPSTNRWWGLLFLFLAVCAGVFTTEALVGAAEFSPVGGPQLVARAESPSQPTAPMPPTTSADRPAVAGGLFAGQSELSLEQLVLAVEARNPSLQAAAAAWRAAAARYPQVISLEDPMFAFMLATANLGANEGEAGYMLEVSQEVPWFGKRRLRGQQALAEAGAARSEIGDVRLQLREAARIAFASYYLSDRLAAVNAETTRLLDQFLQVAGQRYEVGQTTQQDLLQAEVELGQLHSRRAEFRRDVGVATARINTLLHQPPDFPLPPPPANLPVPEPPSSAEPLHAIAIQSRPDLAAQAARIEAQQAALALACKEYYPDMEFIGRYDATMEDEAMRPMVGMAFNVPIQLQRRNAAVREAVARVQQETAEYQNRVNQARYDVQSAYERLVQGRAILRLYTDRILPAAQQNLEAALANYTTGNIDFLRLLDAERQLNNQRETYYSTMAEYHQRLAELERAVGGVLPLPENR